MLNNEMIVKYLEWKELEEQAKAERERIESLIKEEMEKEGTEEKKVGRFIIRFTSILSNRFNSTEFKKVHPDLYKLYTKQVASKRFTVSD